MREADLRLTEGAVDGYNGQRAPDASLGESFRYFVDCFRKHPSCLDR